MNKNELVGLPTSIQRLTKLEKLHLSGNKLTKLPAEIGDLKELRELSVNKNELVGLPTSIERLTKLEKLHLSGNELTKLPAKIGDLRELRELCVDSNRSYSFIQREIRRYLKWSVGLVGLPASVQRLTKLEKLYLPGNKLTELPAEIGDLRELRGLWVRDNQLVGLPTSIQRLTKLERLDLNGNKLTELPAQIGDLRKLRELRVSNNRLVGLPTSIQRLTKLQLLELNVNKVTELPTEISDLRELELLCVRHNPLTVEAIRRALKLRRKGVRVNGVSGKHGGYCSLINQDVLHVVSKSMVSFLQVLIHFNSIVCFKFQISCEK